MIFGTESECFKASCNDCIARDYNVYSAILIENSYKSGPFMILGMDHFTIVTTELEATRCFYVDLIGLEKGPRPQFPVDGLWLYANGKAILHVISVNSMPNPRRGVLDHMAFSAQGLSSVLDRLDQFEVPYRIIRAPGDERTWQVFFKDPNQVDVELDFDASEIPPDDWKIRSRK